jgi:hypothetical protein
MILVCGRSSATVRLSLIVLTAVVMALVPEAGYAGVQKEVRFAKGASGTVIEGGVIRGERDRYLLGAAKGQYLSIKIESPENNAVVDVYSPGAQYSDETDIRGTTLPQGKEIKSATLQLPASGQYLLVVGGTRGNAQYRLSVSVSNTGPESMSVAGSQGGAATAARPVGSGSVLKVADVPWACEVNSGRTYYLFLTDGSYVGEYNGADGMVIQLAGRYKLEARSIAILRTATKLVRLPPGTPGADGSWRPTQAAENLRRSTRIVYENSFELAEGRLRMQSVSIASADGSNRIADTGTRHDCKPAAELATSLNVMRSSLTGQLLQ